MAEARAEKLEARLGLSRPLWEMGNQRLGMWLFLLSDALTFAALMLAYGYLRLAGNHFPQPFSLSPDILLAVIMTVTLLAGALMVSIGVDADRKSTCRWFWLTVVTGILFTALQAKEWLDLMNAGLSFNALPESWLAVWPQALPLFGATFYSITGFHLLHVLAGVIWLAVIAARMKNISGDTLAAAALYWNFVCLLWLCVFAFVYLLSIDTGGFLKR